MGGSKGCHMPSVRLLMPGGRNFCHFDVFNAVVLQAGERPAQVHQDLGAPASRHHQHSQAAGHRQDPGAQLTNNSNIFFLFNFMPAFLFSPLFWCHLLGSFHLLCPNIHLSVHRLSLCPFNTLLSSYFVFLPTIASLSLSSVCESFFFSFCHPLIQRLPLFVCRSFSPSVIPLFFCIIQLSYLFSYLSPPSVVSCISHSPFLFSHLLFPSVILSVVYPERFFFGSRSGSYFSVGFRSYKISLQIFLT